MTTAQQLTLIHYINTPHVKSFQEIAGPRLENISKKQQWAITTVVSKAAISAKRDDMEFVNTLETLSTILDLMPSDKTLKCLKRLNEFPVDRVTQLLDAIEDIRPLRAFPAWAD